MLLHAGEFGARVRARRLRQGSSLRGSPLVPECRRRCSRRSKPASRCRRCRSPSGSRWCSIRASGSCWKKTGRRVRPTSHRSSHRTQSPRRHIMLVATRSFVDKQTGEQIEAGRHHVIEGHELARRNPGSSAPSDRWLETECIRVTAERPPPRRRDVDALRVTAIVAAPRPGSRPRATFPLEEEDRVRRERLAEFEREEARQESAAARDARLAGNRR